MKTAKSPRLQIKEENRERWNRMEDQLDRLLGMRLNFSINDTSTTTGDRHDTKKSQSSILPDPTPNPEKLRASFLY